MTKIIFQSRLFLLFILSSISLPAILNGQDITQPQWTSQLDAGDWGACFELSADGSGNVYSTGFTVGTIEGVKAKAKDAFLAKYDSTGKLVWGKVIGTNANEEGNGVAVHADSVYITGNTQGQLGESSSGGIDAFVSKFDSAGTVSWTKQFGTKAHDQGENITTDQQGNLLVTGWTDGNFKGTNAGKDDVFVVKLNPSGELIWKVQFGTEGIDHAYGIATDQDNNVLVVGSTEGKLGDQHAGNSDAFLANLTQTEIKSGFSR